MSQNLDSMNILNRSHSHLHQNHFRHRHLILLHINQINQSDLIRLNEKAISNENYSFWLNCIRMRQNTMTRMIAFHSN
jgi:hypothetical protein